MADKRQIPTVTADVGGEAKAAQVLEAAESASKSVLTNDTGIQSDGKPLVDPGISNDHKSPF